MMRPSLKRAVAWLSRKQDLVLPVVTDDRGYARFAAYVFRIKRPTKPSVWYLVTMAEQFEADSVKRICLY